MEQKKSKLRSSSNLNNKFDTDYTDNQWNILIDMMRIPFKTVDAMKGFLEENKGLSYDEIMDKVICLITSDINDSIERFKSMKSDRGLDERQKGKDVGRSLLLDRVCGLCEQFQAEVDRSMGRRNNLKVKSRVCNIF